MPRDKMALMGCVGTRAHDALLQALEEAVKENALSRLDILFREGRAGSDEINRKQLLHEAAWLGHPSCVKLLLQYGADPDKFHKGNGCTPLHLAHFRTNYDTNPETTIRALLSAGAGVNNRGGEKCGRLPIDHAIQFQRLDSVQTLLSSGSTVTLHCVLLSIDVSNPQILETLLMSGAKCGPVLEHIKFWGQPFERVINSPLKCPKECYKQMFQMVVQATVCRPLMKAACEKEHKRHQASLENELKMMAKESPELTRYLYVFLLRAGLNPSESLRKFGKTLNEPDWVESYFTSAVSLRDMCVRVIRSRLYLCGNIMYGANRLRLPESLRLYILLTYPF